MKRIAKYLTLPPAPPRRALEAILALCGVGLIAAGLYQIYAPLCPIFVGLAVLAEVLSVRSGSKS